MPGIDRVMEWFGSVLLGRLACWLLSKLAWWSWLLLAQRLALAYSHVWGPDALETIRAGLRDREGHALDQVKWLWRNAWSEVTPAARILWVRPLFLIRVAATLVVLSNVCGTAESGFLIADVALSLLMVMTLIVGLPDPRFWRRRVPVLLAATACYTTISLGLLFAPSWHDLPHARGPLGLFANTALLASLIPALRFGWLLRHAIGPEVRA